MASGDKNLHKDHRARLREKALPRVDALTTPQLVELMLFEALPRCDTNEIGHKLLEKYGGVEGLLRLDETIDLSDGKANVTTQYLHALSAMCRRYAAYRSPDCESFHSMSAARAWFLERLRDGAAEETCVLTLTKDLVRVRFSRYPTAETKPEALMQRLGTDAVSDFCPFLFLGFTHPQGLPLLTRQEKRSVSELSRICFHNNVRFADVLIVSGNDCNFLSESDAFPPGTFLRFNEDK